MYNKGLHSIEAREKSDNQNLNENQTEPCISQVTNQSDDRTIWTFDTSVSEQIINNRNILSNFKEENLILKCVNNSLCKFEGIGTLESKYIWF
jgi:hypothetical protein